MSTEFSTEFLSAPGEQTGGAMLGGRVFNLKRFLRMRARLMVLVFLCLAIPLVPLAWFAVPLEYRAQANIQFLEKRVNVLGTGRDQGPFSDYDKWVRTQANLIERGPILPRVLAEEEVRQLPAVRESEAPLDFLQSQVSADVNPNTNLVTVTCSMQNRDAAQAIVRVTVNKYMDYALGQAGGINEEVMKLLIKERDEMESQLNALRERIRLRKRDAGVLATEGDAGLYTEGQTYREQLSEAQTNLYDAQAQLARFQTYLDELAELRAKHEANPDQPIYQHQIEERVEQDLTVARLQDLVAEREIELARLKDRYREGQKQVNVAEEEMASAQERLTESKREARSELLNAMTEQYRLSLEEAQALADGAQARVEQFQEKLKEADQKILELADAQSEVELSEKQAAELQDVLNDVRQRIREKNAESNAPANILWDEIVHADKEPSYGGKFQVVALALVLSMCAAVCAGVLRELTDQNVRTVQDVAQLTDVPIVAVVPHISMDRMIKTDSIALIAGENPGSITADEYRRMLTRVIYPQEDTPELNSCLLTSPSQGDGATSASCNLAISLALAGRKVLLVDVGARRNEIEGIFGLPRGRGLSEVLAQECAPSEVVQDSPYAGLQVLGPGLEPAALMGRLASRAMIEFLEGAERAFEHVVIDAPPALLMAEAKLLAPVVDGVILVVGAEVSTMGKVRRCIGELRQGGANLVGIVLTGVKQTPGGYLQENLASYYSYNTGLGAQRTMAQPTLPPRRTGPEPVDSFDLGAQEDDVEESIILVDEDEETGDR